MLLHHGAHEILPEQQIAREKRARPSAPRARPAEDRRRLPRATVAALALTLLGFAATSPLGIAPVWVAAAGAAAVTLPALVRGRARPAALVRTAEPGFLVFVLGLGVIVAAASNRGVATAVGALVPDGESLPALLLIALLGAVLANLVNNLPATLILAPVAAATGPVPVLAALIGVNVGPNLTYVGSLATLLWRRVLRHEDTDVDAGEFVRLGALDGAGGARGGDRPPMVRREGGVRMRALVWIVDDTWAATVDEAAAHLPADAAVTLLHVAPADVEHVAGGRRPRAPRPAPPPAPERPLRAISEAAAAELLADAASAARPRRRAARPPRPGRARSGRGRAGRGHPRAGARRRPHASRPAQPRPGRALRRRSRPLPGAAGVAGRRARPRHDPAP